MQLIQPPYLPLSLNTVERSIVFDYFTLKSALFSKPISNEFPHFYMESEASYSAPIMTDRIVQTPNHGMRLIIAMAIPINPMYGFNASGIWNFALPMAQDLILPA